MLPVLKGVCLPSRLFKFKMHCPLIVVVFSTSLSSFEALC